MEPHFSGIDLSSGFAPDPFTSEAESGGEVDVRNAQLGFDCIGYAAPAPDFRLNWTGSTDNLRIIFEADQPGEDAVLIINAPDGTWVCNDDAHEGTLNPMVILSGYDSGQYDIWIASLSEGVYIAGKLIVTERTMEPK